MQAELMAGERDYTPRRRQERERKPIPDTLGKLTGSQRENARRHLSGELIRALSHVEKHWRPGWFDKSLLAPGGHTIGARLFGPGRAPIPEGDEPDFYTLRYKTHGAIIGAEGGMFVLNRHQLVMRDEAYFRAVAHLNGQGLCCEACAGSADKGDDEFWWHDPFSKPEEHRLQPGERCFFNETLRSPLPIWVTHVDRVARAEMVPAEHVQVALALFDRAVAYQLDEEPFVRRSPGRPKKDVR